LYKDLISYKKQKLQIKEEETKSRLVNYMQGELRPTTNHGVIGWGDEGLYFV